MVHQCVKCGKVYGDGSSELLKGCQNCGGKFFFFIKKEKLSETVEEVEKLSVKEREKIERDVLDIVGSKIDDDSTVILDLESIRVLKPGKFEVDIVNLMRGKPVVFKMENGKYIIDLATTFQQTRKSEQN
ncbi:hypothetical protein J4442_03315 [Candidatus Woesearchaeota archaeon]|nr:hypothetical protein [Candidatus Woesearchaeota archaeon]